MTNLNGKMHFKRYTCLTDIERDWLLSESDIDLCLTLLRYVGHVCINQKDGLIVTDLPHCRHTGLGFLERRGTR